MAQIDLEKYKSAWKSEPGFKEARLSETDILRYTHSASKNFQGILKKGLKIDLFLKTGIALASIGTSFLYSAQNSILFISILLFLFAIGGILHQLIKFKIIPEGDEANQSMKNVLRNYIDFYYKHYISSLFIAAANGPLLFICGSLFYFYFKYGFVNAFDNDDYLFYGIFLILSYLLGSYSQFYAFNFHILQLEDSLKDIELEQLDVQSLKRYKYRKYRHLILMGIALITGLLLFVFFILS